MMDRETIDQLWQTAMRQSIEDGEQFTRYHFAKLVTEHVARVERNKLANWMMEFAFATGHGDTMEELLDELGTEVVDTIDAAREDEREAIIAILKGIDETEIESPDGWWETSEGAAFGASILAAIRARSNT